MSSSIAEAWKEDKACTGACQHKATSNDDEEEEEEEEEDSNKNLLDDTTMPAHKSMNGTGKKAMAARQAPQCKAKDNDGMEGLVSSIKQLDLSEGFFSHEVVKGYPVGTLIWTDKTSLQKYVEFQIIVPLCTNAADLHRIPVLADGGKQVQVWICKEPKAAEYNPMVFPGICLDQHASQAQGDDFDSKITRYTEAVEICKCQAGTGETCELLVNLPFECDHKVFLVCLQQPNKSNSSPYNTSP